MKQATGWAASAALAALLLAAGPAAAAPAPGERTGLSHVPASAPIVIHIKGVEGVKGRLIALIKEALPEMAPQIIPHLEEGFKEALQGRKLAGMSKDGPIFIVFTEVPKPGVEPPKMAVLIAVDKYEEFRDNILKEEERKALKSNGAGVERTTIENEAAFFVDRKGYAVVAPTEDVATLFTKKQPGLDGKMSRAQAAKLLSSDFGVYISLDTLSKEYAAQIKEGKEQAQKALEQIEQTVGKAQRGSIEMLQKLIGPVFQALGDSQGVLLTAEFRPAGMAIHLQSELRSGSTTSSALKNFKTAAFTDLGRMPPGEVFYFGTDTNAKMLESLGGLAVGAMVDKDAKQAKEIEAALDQMARAGPGVRVDSAAIPPTGLQVWQFEDPAKAVAAMTKLARSADAGGALQGGVLKEKPVIKEGAEKYNDFTLTSVELAWDVEKMAAQAGAGNELPKEIQDKLAEGMKTLLGEKLRYWYGTDGKVFVQVTAKDWASAERLLDRYFKGQKGIGEVAAFRDVRKEMPQEATMLAVVDLIQYLGMMVDTFKPLAAGFFPLPPTFPGKPDKPSYVGGSVSLGAERGSLDIYISAAAVHEAFKAFAQPFLPGT
jgi:hypothetical protein